MSRSEKDITAKLLKDLRNSQLKTIVHVDFFGHTMELSLTRGIFWLQQKNTIYHIKQLTGKTSLTKWSAS